MSTQPVSLLVPVPSPHVLSGPERTGTLLVVLLSMRQSTPGLPGSASVYDVEEAWVVWSDSPGPLWWPLPVPVAKCTSSSDSITPPVRASTYTSRTERSPSLVRPLIRTFHARRGVASACTARPGLPRRAALRRVARAFLVAAAEVTFGFTERPPIALRCATVVVRIWPSSLVTTTKSPPRTGRPSWVRVYDANCRPLPPLITGFAANRSPALTFSCGAALSTSAFAERRASLCGSSFGAATATPRSAFAGCAARGATARAEAATRVAMKPPVRFLFTTDPHSS